MIRFHCPKCKKVLQAAEQQGGLKAACPGCGQRLQIPAPDQNKTVLGSLLPARNPTAGQTATPPAGSSAPAATQAGRMWFYADKGQRHGPISWAELQHRAAAGRLDANALVWTAGMPAWVAAGTISDLSLPAAGRKSAVMRPVRRGRFWAWSGLGMAAAVCMLVAAFLAILGSRSAPHAQAQEIVHAPGKRDEPQKESAKAEPKKGQPKKADPIKKAETPKKEEKPRELTTREIVARSEKSVALIRATNGGHGTGFVVRPGIIATNAHVIATAAVDQLRVYFPSAGEAGKQPLLVEAVFYVDHKRDLALLKVNSNLPPLPVAAHYEFQRGQDVTVIGNPGAGDGRTALENAVSRGVMSSQLTIDGMKHYQLSITVNPGNSGGPVFDPTGQVIGVIDLKANKREGIAFCIPVRDLHAALAKVERQGPQDTMRMTSLHNRNAAACHLIIIGKNYADGLDESLKALEAALKTGRIPAQALADFRQQNAKPL
jgi:S1-C subfamily serine protease/phage FluMu protein Com